MINRFVLLFLLFCSCVSLLLQTKSLAQEVRAGFTTTPLSVVEGMLDFAGAGMGDYVIDLGSGDGRLVIAAAKRGALGLGVEIDPDLINTSLENAIAEGVQDRVHFLKEDLFFTDISAATVITLYLLESMNIDLKPAFLAQLEPGSVIVSHRYKIGRWLPDDEKEIDFRKVYKWIVPADFSGTWSWYDQGNKIKMNLAQEFQRVAEIEIQSDNFDLTYKIESASIMGDRLTLKASHPETGLQYAFFMKLRDDVLKGVVHIGSGPDKRITKLNAYRVP
jgi:cyclopropane fatty-acyl-phospholipid synthase-like methyltransferase